MHFGGGYTIDSTVLWETVEKLRDRLSPSKHLKNTADVFKIIGGFLP